MIFYKLYNKLNYKSLLFTLLIYLLTKKIKSENVIAYLDNETETTNPYKITDESTSLNFNVSYRTIEINNIDNNSNEMVKKIDSIDNIETLNADTIFVNTTESSKLYFSFNLNSYYMSNFSNILHSKEDLFFTHVTKNYNYSIFDSLQMKNTLSMGDVFINIILSFIFLTIIILTLVGNLLVILAVVIVRKLHTEDNANNFLIVNLAVSDFLVGVLVMPFAFYVELSEDNK